MTYNSLPPASRSIFEKLSKRTASSYILDYVTAEYESIISCPSVDDYFSNPKRFKNDYSNTTPRVVQYEASGLPSPPLSSPEKMALSNPYHNSYQRPVSFPPTPSSLPPVSLRSYMESVVKKSRIDTGTLLSSLAYARRLKSKLAHTSKGMECTHHRIFLATLIISSKYIHDSALKNKYWVHYAQIFSASEINLMEKQLLQLLDYNLEIKSSDYNIIVNDIVRLYANHQLAKEKAYTKSTVARNENRSFYEIDQAYKNCNFDQRLKPSPPLLSGL